MPCGQPNHRLAVCDEQPVQPHRRHRYECLHGDDVDVRVQHDVRHAFLPEPASPSAQSESVMEHDHAFRFQDGSQTPIRVAIQVFQESHGHMPAALGLLLVLGMAGGRRRPIYQPADRLVQYFHAIQCRLIPVALGETFQHRQRIFHGLRVLAPCAYACDSAIVVTVLRARHGVQVKQHLQSAPIGPSKSAVHIFDASWMSLHIAEDEVRNGNAHQIVSV